LEKDKLHKLFCCDFQCSFTSIKRLNIAAKVSSENGPSPRVFEEENIPDNIKLVVHALPIESDQY
jgi:hypothetical protein